MQYYQNKSGRSNIVAFEIGVDHITIMFRGNSIYTYNYQSAGSEVVEHMKKLALQGYGLNSFISSNKPQHFATNYVKKRA